MTERKRPSKLEIVGLVCLMYDIGREQLGQGNFVIADEFMMTTIKS